MPDISADKQMAAAYPPEALYESWSDHADELDMPISQFIIEMVEAGRKQIDLEEYAADSIRELRDQRDDLRNEVRRQRARVEELERQLDRTARTDIVAFIEENPGATTPEIVQHAADTVPGRTIGLLDALDGRSLRERDGQYYVLDEPESSDSESDTDDSDANAEDDPKASTRTDTTELTDQEATK
ncbi:hypothetical protein SAMN04488065_1264 [Haloplanus vescus]|uniref:Uncharacterized protein n=1 Tax=Haloplanus vescus TaxID=555874 RepID=A0A1H3X140_9EURY|nr:hypothetical protein [Haloplanus vescus]SDZ92691.1 hypothetical protein SAMN04488065_1264 [Haloplanus vescus]